MSGSDTDSDATCDPNDVICGNASDQDLFDDVPTTSKPYEFKSAPSKLHDISDSDSDDVRPTKKQKLQEQVTVTPVEATSSNRTKLSPVESRKKKEKPICKYGAKCYRKNPSHLQDFRHPGKLLFTVVNCHYEAVSDRRLVEL